MGHAETLANQAQRVSFARLDRLRPVNNNSAIVELKKIDQETVEKNTQDFFKNSRAFTYGNMPASSVGRIIDKFPQLVFQARSIPDSEPRVRKYLLPSEEDSSAFLRKYGIWDDSLRENNEGRELVHLLKVGSGLQKYLLYTSYFNLLVITAHDFERNGKSSANLESSFEIGIDKMYQDLILKNKVALPKKWQETLGFVHDNPRIVFQERLKKEREKDKSKP